MKAHVDANELGKSSAVLATPAQEQEACEALQSEVVQQQNLNEKGLKDLHNELDSTVLRAKPRLHKPSLRE